MEQRGPYLALAVFCKDLTVDAAGKVTIHEIVREHSVEAVGSGSAPERRAYYGVIGPTAYYGTEAAEPPVEVTVGLGVYGGDRSTGILSITSPRADGVHLILFQSTLTFRGPDDAVYFPAKLQFGVLESGIYWFSVSVDNTLLTRLPLRPTR